MFETTKGEWWPEYRGGQQLFGLRRGSKTTHWRYSDEPVETVLRSDLRIYDDQGDPTAHGTLGHIRER